jgi:hypothetical protein
MRNKSIEAQELDQLRDLYDQLDSSDDRDEREDIIDEIFSLKCEFDVNVQVCYRRGRMTVARYKQLKKLGKGWDDNDDFD